MASERWQRVDELYHAALAKSPADRAAFLAGAVNGDDALRREVESLLSHSTGADDFLSPHALHAALRDAQLSASSTSETHTDVQHAGSLAGHAIGSYELKALIGVGGMGEVYRARDTRLGRDVAIKILPAIFATDRDRLVRFQREARMLASLNHPNIAHIYGIEEGRAVRAIAMELVEGETLAERVSTERGVGPGGATREPRARALPVGEVVVLARQIADALDAAHERGIVHRDLKPANITITPDGVVKVLDFGLAKSVTGDEIADEGSPDPTGTLNVTRDGVIMGTAAYMSPEQARGQAVDKRTDIWAFGCVVFELLSGRKAFGRPTVSDSIAAILERDPPWDELPPVPVALHRLLERCLEKDPKRRQRDIGDARRDLDSVFDQALPDRHAATWRRVAPWVIATAGLAFGAVGWSTHVRSTDVTAPSTTPMLTRVTWDNSLSIEPTLSPDGSLIVYASDVGGGGNLDLWVQRVAGGMPIRLTQDEADDREPDFSPDGLSIAFRSQRNGGGVYVVPALGGDARLIAQGGRRPRFSPEGDEIAYWTGDALGSARTPGPAIFVIPANGGTPRRVANGFFNARTPIWSPDGRSLLFFGRQSAAPAAAAPRDVASQASSEFDWWWIPRAGGEPVATGVYPALIARGVSLLPESLIESLPQAWGRDGVVFSATLGQATNLWQVNISPATGKIAAPPVRLTTGGGRDESASIDRSGHIAFQLAESKESVFALALDSNNGKNLNRIDRLTTDWGMETHRGSISQNGRTLAFPRYRPNSTELWVKNLHTGGERHLVTTQLAQLNPTVSPDGVWVAYTVAVDGGDGRGAGHIVASAGGAARKVCDECEMHSWLADGRHVLTVYPAGHPRIRTIDVETLQMADVFDTNGTVQRVFGSSDNRWLAVSTTSSAWIAPLHVGRAATEAESLSVPLPKSDVVGSRVCGWSPNGRLLYSLLGIDGFRCLYAQRVDPSGHQPPGEPFIVQHFHEPQRAWGSTSMANAITGDRFVYDHVETSSSIWLFEPRTTKP